MKDKINFELSGDLSAGIAKYSHDLSSDIDKALTEIAKESKQKLKTLSPVKTGAYASGWTYTTQNKDGAIVKKVYNKDHYRRVHLIEKGHIVKNQYGYAKKGKKKTRPQPHITPVQEEADKKAEMKIKAIVKKKYFI